MIPIQNAEAVFLTLSARRVLGFQKKAEEAGETYQDLQPFTELQCGYKAKLRFQKGAAGQYRPVLLVKPGPKVPQGGVDSDMLKVAVDILGGPAVQIDNEIESDGRAIEFTNTYVLERDR